LSRADATGDWVRGLQKAGQELDALRVPEWLVPAVRWVTDAPRPVKQEKWFREALDLTNRVVRELHVSTDFSDLRTVPALLELFVLIRNKRAHGARTSTLFRGTYELLCKSVLLLTEHCPMWVSTHVLAEKELMGGERAALVLKGVHPATVTRVPDSQWPRNTENHPASLALQAPEGTILFSSLMRFNPDSQRCFFANSAPDQRLSAEFLDYFDGAIEHQSVGDYALQPTRDTPELKVALFPSSALAQLEAVYPAVGHQRHRPRLMLEQALQALAPQWRSVEFTQLNEVRVPQQPGVYAFSSRCEVASLPSHLVVIYVGQTENLRTRYNSYLQEMTREGGRELVATALNEFPRVDFWYTVITSTEDRLRLEDWMIKAIDPPANTRGRVGFVIPDAERIWRSDA
jgi:hypothetical protein